MTHHHPLLSSPLASLTHPNLATLTLSFFLVTLSYVLLSFCLPHPSRESSVPSPHSSSAESESAADHSSLIVTTLTPSLPLPLPFPARFQLPRVLPFPFLPFRLSLSRHAGRQADRYCSFVSFTKTCRRFPKASLLYFTRSSGARIHGEDGMGWNGMDRSALRYRDKWHS